VGGPGRTILAGRFALEERLGAGASAAVWRAWDHLDPRWVAVKLWDVGAADPRRLAREVAALRRAAHPGLPSLVASGEADGRPFVVMTLLEGVPLRAALRGPMTAAAVRALGLAVCDPLAALHDAGLVHRDLKPEHILLDRERGVERVALVDLGLAVADGDPRAITAGGVVGTPGYLPPEQLRAAPPTAHPRWDVFSLGCVLCECAAGVAPFAAADAPGVLARTLAGAPPELGAVDPPLADLLRSMLAPRESQRPPSASAVRDRLAALDLGAAGEAPGFLAVIIGHAEAGPDEATPKLIEVDGSPDVDAALLPRGARARTLADGSTVVWMAAPRMDADTAARALQCAALLARSLPSRRWSAALGEGDARGPWPRGPAFDRALGLGGAAAGEVHTDALTALLAGDAFAFERRGGHFVLA